MYFYHFLREWTNMLIRVYKDQWDRDVTKVDINDVKYYRDNPGVYPPADGAWIWTKDGRMFYVPAGSDKQACLDRTAFSDGRIEYAPYRGECEFYPLKSDFVA